jgi:hypothetical protein
MNIMKRKIDLGFWIHASIYPAHTSSFRSSDGLPNLASLPCNMNISMLSLLIVLSSREACLLLRKPLALGLRAIRAGGAGRMGSGLLRSLLPDLGT